MADAGNQESLDNIPDWLSEVNKYTGEDVEKILLLNKCDVDEEDRAVSDKELSTFEKDTGIKVLETSAKTGYNVDEAFLTVTKRLMEKR